MKKPLLPPASTFTGEERFRIGQGGEARLASSQMIKDFVGTDPGIAAEATARANADTAEAQARSNADAAEASVRKASDDDEAAARIAADDAATSDRQALAARVKTLEYRTLRVARFTGTTASTGIATITFNPAFNTVPDVDVIQGWNGEQEIGGAVVGTPTKTGCSVQVMVSRATLLLSTGPFQKAGTGVSVTVRAIGT